MIIVIIGPQGSGKGTQAKLLAKELGLFHMESGRMLRRLARSDKRIKKMIDNGKLIPDAETLNYIGEYLIQKKASLDDLIFDGYPRNLEQYKLLNDFLNKKGKRIDYVVFIDISEKETIKRLSARRTCIVCGEVYNLITNPPPGNKCKCGRELVLREDDKPDAIKKRLAIFNKKTKPIIDLIEKEKIFIKVDGERPISVILKEILNKLEK